MNWKVKAVSGLMALGLATRWLAGHPEVADGLSARVFGAMDWLVLTGLFAGVLLASVRVLRAGLTRLWRMSRPTDPCAPCGVQQDC